MSPLKLLLAFLLLAALWILATGLQLKRNRCIGATLMFLALAVMPDGVAAQALYFEGGPPALRIGRIMPGRAVATATDASSTLVYRRASQEGQERKVMVSVDGALARFDLSVEATDPTPGTSTGPVLLQDGRGPTDLLRDVTPCPQRGGGPACEGRTTLRYRLRASIDDRPGRTAYTVRYTLIAQ